MIDLPRQARDKHRENSKSGAFFAGILCHVNAFQLERHPQLGRLPGRGLVLRDGPRVLSDEDILVPLRYWDGQLLADGLCAPGKKTHLFAPFHSKPDHFTKTGSGQTQGELRKEVRALAAQRDCSAPRQAGWDRAAGLVRVRRAFLQQGGALSARELHQVRDPELRPALLHDLTATKWAAIHGTGHRKRSGPRDPGAKTHFFCDAMCDANNDHFTKTGSGQT
jgi:hypothetical protein